jgi:hypothetical protein
MARGRFAALAHALPCPIGPVFAIAPRCGLLPPAPLCGNDLSAVLDAPIGTHAIFCRAQPRYRLRDLRVQPGGSDLLRPRGSPLRLRLVAVPFFCGAVGAGFAAGRLQALRLMNLPAAGSKVPSVDWGERIHQLQARPSGSPGRSRRRSVVQPCGAVSAAGVSAAFPLAFAQSVVHRAAGFAGPEVPGLKPPASRTSRPASRRSPSPVPACPMCQASPIFPRALSRFARGS